MITVAKRCGVLKLTVFVVQICTKLSSSKQQNIYRTFQDVIFKLISLSHPVGMKCN